MKFRFFSCCQRMKAIRQSELLRCLDAISLNNADSFFSARYCLCPLMLPLHPSQFGILKRISYFFTI